MRKLKGLLPIFTICAFLAVYFYSCDDSGTATHNDNVTFSYSGLKSLNQSTDGIYEAWIYFGSPYNWYISCGKFNLNSTGQVVDSIGNPVTLKLKYRPYDFNTAQFSLITIDPPNYYDSTPPPLRLLGGDVTYSSDYLTASLNMQHKQALDSIGRSFTSAVARYVLYTPTDTTKARWFDGIWFSDTSGNGGFVGLSSIPQNATGWKYSAWIDSSSVKWERIGRFFNVYAADDDGAGPYAGPLAGYSYPGQDYLYNNQPIFDLRGGWYTIHVCLEPTQNSNRFLDLFVGGVPNTITVGHLTTLPSNSANLPTASIKISTQ